MSLGLQLHALCTSLLLEFRPRYWRSAPSVRLQCAGVDGFSVREPSGSIAAFSKPSRQTTRNHHASSLDRTRAACDGCGRAPRPQRESGCRSRFSESPVKSESPSRPGRPFRPGLRDGSEDGSHGEGEKPTPMRHLFVDVRTDHGAFYSAGVLQRSQFRPRRPLWFGISTRRRPYSLQRIRRPRRRL